MLSMLRQGGERGNLSKVQKCKNYFCFYLSRRTIVLSLQSGFFFLQKTSFLFNNHHTTPQSFFVRLLLILQDFMFRHCHSAFMKNSGIFDNASMWVSVFPQASVTMSSVTLHKVAFSTILELTVKKILQLLNHCISKKSKLWVDRIFKNMWKHRTETLPSSPHQM